MDLKICNNLSFKSVDVTFRNISDFMTTFIRQGGQNNHSESAKGLVMHAQTCLQVRWGWLSLPAALIILTLSFFVLMMVETRSTGDRAQIWKSSPLAFIIHGLEAHNELHDSLFLEDITDMKYAAKRIQVRLATTTRGIKLVSVKDER